MIKLTVALPLTTELEAQCKELTLDNSKLPPIVARAAAMQGIPLSMFKLNKVSYDWGTAHFTFVADGESEFVTLPTIPFTEDNFHPLHGPSQSWWVSMNRAGVDGPNILEPLVVEEVKAALGGLDLTGKEVNCVTRGLHGYQISIRRAVLNAPVWSGADPASGPDTTVEAEITQTRVRSPEAGPDYTVNGYRKQPEAKGEQGIVGKALDSVLDALTIGSMLD